MMYKHLKETLKMRDRIYLKEMDKQIDEWFVGYPDSRCIDGFILRGYKFRGLVSKALGYSHRPNYDDNNEEIRHICDVMYLDGVMGVENGMPIARNLEDLSNLVDWCIGKIKEQGYDIYINDDKT